MAGVKRIEPGRGSVRKDGRRGRRIFVSFDEETFDEIRVHATREGLCFTAAVRELVEFGLVDVKCSDPR